MLSISCFLVIPTAGIPLSFSLPATQPVEVNCNGMEGSIQECQLVRFLQCPSATIDGFTTNTGNGTIAGVNCTGMCKVCNSCLYYIISFLSWLKIWLSMRAGKFVLASKKPLERKLACFFPGPSTQLCVPAVLLVLAARAGQCRH